MYVALPNRQSVLCYREALYIHPWPLLLTGSPIGVEVTAKVLPALGVALVQSLAGFQPPFGHSHAEGRLKHEGLEGAQKGRNWRTIYS